MNNSSQSTDALRPWRALPFLINFISLVSLFLIPNIVFLCYFFQVLANAADHLDEVHVSPSVYRCTSTPMETGHIVSCVETLMSSHSKV